MSYYFPTIPKNITFIMRDKYDLEIFVETGTYTGATAEWAARHFYRVYTIEKQHEYFTIAENRMLNLHNVVLYMNDSLAALPYVLNAIENKGTLFYLDAHWSEGAHYGRPPIDSAALDEIELINQWCNPKHVIIVDDAHRFGTEHWPTKQAIVKALENDGKRSVRELLDVLIAEPSQAYLTVRRKYADASIDAASTVSFSLRGIRN